MDVSCDGVACIVRTGTVDADYYSELKNDSEMEEEPR